ncbi:hypothetical protein EVAR_56531_1 [Eumeta japonica]|uniref:Uncharacterized protein n=1 Tax=Eumeta variegata TaxID=151549 RepID=A0A4C1YZ98_EUMVA|nr:hypothetical protein EVAR_56531_1 [Eumeta japonica]
MEVLRCEAWLCDRIDPGTSEVQRSSRAHTPAPLVTVSCAGRAAAAAAVPSSVDIENTTRFGARESIDETRLRPRALRGGRTLSVFAYNWHLKRRHGVVDITRHVRLWYTVLVSSSDGRISVSGVSPLSKGNKVKDGALKPTLSPIAPCGRFLVAAAGNNASRTTRR